VSKQPFMPLFFGDFLAATGEWEGEEASLYLTLLGHQWSLGSLPSDTRKLARLVKWDQELFNRCWSTVSTKFIQDGDRLLNERLEEHRQKSKDISAKNSGSGRKGAESRWRKDGARHPGANGETMANATNGDSERHKSANGVTNGNPSHPIPSHPIPESPSTSPSNSEVHVLRTRERTETGGDGRPNRDLTPVASPSTRAHAFADAELMDAFAVVRSAYPKFTGRQDWPNAEHHWRMRIEQGATPHELIAGVERYAAYVDAGGVSGPAFVMTPGKFFSAVDRPWAQAWAPPPTKAEVRLGKNLTAAEEFMRRTEPAA
jgi:uncharacterized protein YdaU (DUF1376 family)